MLLQQQIREELKNSMKAKSFIKTVTLKSLLSAFANELIAQKKRPQDELDDDRAIAIIKKSVKQRKDSIEQFQNGDREDLAKKEQKELKFLEIYLPETMNLEEIKKLAKVKKEELKITDKSKMGILIGSLMKELKNKAEGNDVKKVVEELLN